MSVIVLTDSWLDSYFQDVIHLTAQRAEVKDREWKSAIELLGELELSRPTINSKLRQYIAIYKQWFQDSKEFNQKLLDGTLTQEDKNKSISHVFARNDARNELLNELART
jgi:hypothetical protein